MRCLHLRELAIVFGIFWLDAHATSLPSISVAGRDAHIAHTSALDAENKWWTRVGDKVFHQPEESSGLSRDIGNYFYAIGSEAGVPDSLKQHRVGGEGRYHVFHLSPAFASMLQTSSKVTTDRRSSMSTLNKLEHGQVLSAKFPAYQLKAGYQSPLSGKAKELEKASVSKITKEGYKKFLEDITSLTSRSYTHEDTTTGAVNLVKQEFQNLGYQPCSHSFGQGQLQNVIAVQKGTEPGYVVVGAHYDSRPYDGKAPGAEDNGSGVAGLLAMAKAFKGIVPKKSVYFVGFAGEEGGMIGSSAFSKAMSNGQAGIPESCRLPSSLIQTGSKEAGAIIMDEIGWLSTNKEVYPRPTVNLEGYTSNDDIKDHLYSSAQDNKLLSVLDIIASPTPFGSDHMSFTKSVLTINGDDEAYPNYHMSTDTIDNVDVEYASNIAKMNMGGLLRIAGVNEESSLLQTQGSKRIRTSIHRHL
jgi:hypothetical protein